MSYEEKSLIDLQGIYGTKLIISASKLAANYIISETWELIVDTGREPGEWKVLNKQTANISHLEEAPEAVKKAALECILTYRVLTEAPGSVKKAVLERINEPIDNLKTDGFEELPGRVDSIPEESLTDKDEENKKAHALMAQKRKQDEEKLEALERGEIERLEALENGKIEKPDVWKKGGYEKAKETKYEEVESQNKVKLVRPGRTIKGLTLRLAECGKIKIGIKGKTTTSQKGNSFRAPQKLDHFIVTTMDKTEGDDFKQDEELMKKLGTWDNFGGYHCTQIPVRLPYDDPSLNFSTSYAYYDSAACQCRGDGQTAIRADGLVVDCFPETCICVKEQKCKPNGVLSLILDDAPRVGGVYKFRTTGYNSINNLFSSMEFIRGLTNGLLAGLPLMLTLTPKHTVIPGTRTATTIYMVNLEYRGSLQEMVTAIQQTMNTRTKMQYSVRDFERLAEEALSIPEAPEECKEIIAEFYPESAKVV